MRHITAPITAESNSSETMAPTICRITCVKSTKAVSQPRYTRDFQYPHNQKPTGVWGHSILHSRFISPSSVKDSNGNILTSLAMWGGASSYIKLTTGNVFLSCNAGVTWSRKSIRFKKKKLRIKSTVKPCQSVIWGVCSYLAGSYEVLTSPKYDCCVYLYQNAVEKKASSIHMTFSYH